MSPKDEQVSISLDGGWCGLLFFFMYSKNYSILHIL